MARKRKDKTRFVNIDEFAAVHVTRSGRSFSPSPILCSPLSSEIRFPPSVSIGDINGTEVSTGIAPFHASNSDLFTGISDCSALIPPVSTKVSDSFLDFATALRNYDSSTNPLSVESINKYMEPTFNVGELSSCDEPNNINNNDIQSVEFIDKWPVDIGSCDGDDIIKEYLNNVETSSSVEPNRVCEDDDCMILDGDPDKPIVVAVDEKIDSDDILIVKEKGQVACRDFPHARHSCANFPFSTTSHEQYCKMCHCFVCDSPAPCKFWSNIPGGHCHASDKFESWISLRKKHKDSSDKFKSWISLRKKHKDAIVNANKAIAPTQRQAPNVPNLSNPDFPHFRHSCGNFPFDTTSHEQHCKMCRCFVCDSPAPCKFWSNFPDGHCQASDKFELWISLKKRLKDAIANTNKVIAPTRRQARNIPNSPNPPHSPHFRHLRANFPFNTTSHEQHCKMCRAPCKFWGYNQRCPCHEVPNAFSCPASTFQQQVLNTHDMNNTNNTSQLNRAHIQTPAFQQSKRQPYSNAPSNTKRSFGPPSVHQTQFKRHGTTPGYVCASRSQALQHCKMCRAPCKLWGYSARHCPCHEVPNGSES